MITRKTITKKEEVIDDYVCNKCGGSCTNGKETHSFATISFHNNRGKCGLPPSKQISHLCSECYYELADAFIHFITEEPLYGGLEDKTVFTLASHFEPAED